MIVVLSCWWCQYREAPGGIAIPWMGYQCTEGLPPVLCRRLQFIKKKHTHTHTQERSSERNTTLNWMYLPNSPCLQSLTRQDFS